MCVSFYMLEDYLFQILAVLEQQQFASAEQGWLQFVLEDALDDLGVPAAKVFLGNASNGIRLGISQCQVVALSAGRNLAGCSVEW